MNTEEFSSEFDTLLNSYSIINNLTGNGSSIELDEYEKSVFLTKAQEELIIEFYNGKNSTKDSFEKTEEIRRYLSSLVKTYITSTKNTSYTGLSNTSTFFNLPPDLWFITYESVNLKDENLGCKDNKDVVVVPITQDDYYKLINNPFRGPNDRRVLRLDNDNNIVELISKYNIENYLVRYISQPEPIILTDLTDNLSINNISIKTECKLHPALHRAILEYAVKLALISRNKVTNKQ